MAKQRKGKYPNLSKNQNLVRRQELIDFDYLDKLSETEKEWLDKFMGEYMGASFPKEEITRNDTGTTYKRHSIKNKHKKRKVKEVYDSNNARNRDIYSKKMPIGGISFFDEVTLDNLRERDLYTETNNFEDGVIERDFMQKNSLVYKEQVLEYIATLSSTKRKDKGTSEREEEINYLKKNGYAWIFED